MTTAQELISAEDFFGPPARIDTRISPDGLKVAYLAPWRNRLNVFVRDLGGDWPQTAVADDPASRRVTSDDHRSIETFLWAAGSRFLLFLQDTDGDENAHLHRAAPRSPRSTSPRSTGRVWSVSSCPRIPGRCTCSSTRAAPS